MCYKSNISAAVPKSKIELKEGMEVKCIKDLHKEDNPQLNRWETKGKWYRIDSVQANALIIGDNFNRSHIIPLNESGFNASDFFDLTNPRWPEKMEKDNGIADKYATAYEQTFGKGINPEKVEEMLGALHHVRQLISRGLPPSVDTYNRINTIIHEAKL